MRGCDQRSKHMALNGTHYNTIELHLARANTQDLDSPAVLMVVSSQYPDVMNAWLSLFLALLVWPKQVEPNTSLGFRKCEPLVEM